MLYLHERVSSRPSRNMSGPVAEKKGATEFLSPTQISKSIAFAFASTIKTSYYAPVFFSNPSLIPAVTPLPSLHITLSTLSRAQFDDLLQKRNPNLRQSVDSNVRDGWIFVVLRENLALRSWERLGANSLVLHLYDNQHSKAFDFSVPSIPGVYEV